MLYKTRGIVFRFTKYGETSIIVNIFTDLFGLQSYIVNGVRSKSSKSKIALYQPLTLLDMVVYFRENANINRIKEAKCLQPYLTIPYDVKKSSIAIFINEVLNKTVKEESHAHELFDFLYYSMQVFDALHREFENFHLVFLLKLSRFLGFGAHNVNEVLGPRIAEASEEEILAQLIRCDYEDMIVLTNVQRRMMLDYLLKFYGDHIETLGEIKSVQVLKDVFG